MENIRWKLGKAILYISIMVFGLNKFVYQFKILTFEYL